MRLEQSSTTMRPSTAAVEPNCIAREIAGIRLMLADVVTGEELREQLAEVTTKLDAAVKRLDDPQPADEP